MVVDWWYGSFALIEQLVCCATLLLLYRWLVSEAVAGVKPPLS